MDKILVPNGVCFREVPLYMIVTVQYIDTVELDIVGSNLHNSVTIQVIYMLIS